MITNELSVRKLFKINVFHNIEEVAINSIISYVTDMLLVFFEAVSNS